MPKPIFVTFTGADDASDIDAMIKLSNQYQIEWAFLLGREQNRPRFPSIDFLSKIRSTGGRLLTALHICGPHAVQIANTGRSDFAEFAAQGFGRIQINHHDPIDPQLARALADRLDSRVILQTRDDAFPKPVIVDWLFDRSGGRGVMPNGWPSHHDERLVGYAGGLGPENARSVCDALPATGDFWIDMETKLRTPENRFDIDRCRQVCEAVFGNLE